jgi:hypothetical protein
MNSQPPLLQNGSGSQLPGPQFVPRPGWGGQLGHWFSENAYVVVFRALVLAALVLIVASIIKNNPENLATETPTPTPSIAVTTPLMARANRGDGLTHVSARILDQYLSQQIPPLALSPAQHLFAVDALARSAGWGRLEVDQEVAFTRESLDVIVIKAEALTPAQRAAWARLLRPR